jgi:hypothetical protein
VAHGEHLLRWVLTIDYYNCSRNCSAVSYWTSCKSRYNKKTGDYFVNPTLISLTVFACTFGGALLGLWLRTVLPEHHLSDESRDTIKVGIALIATMTALVLGLVTASAKVVERFVEVGEHPDVGAPIVRLVDTIDLEISARAPATCW